MKLRSMTPSLPPHLDSLIASVEYDDTLIEQFKTENALLQNSIAIFSRTLEEIYDEHEWAASLSLGNLMMRFAADPRKDLARRIATQLDQLSDVNSAVGKNGAIVARHGQMVVNTLPIVDQIVSSIIDSSTSVHAQALQRAYLSAYGAVSARASWSRIALSAVTLTLCGCVAILVQRLGAQSGLLARRLSFERVIGKIKGRFHEAQVSDVSTEMGPSLSLLTRFFGAAGCQLTIFNFETKEIECQFDDANGNPQTDSYGMIKDLANQFARSRKSWTGDRVICLDTPWQRQDLATRPGTCVSVATELTLPTKAAAFVIWFDRARRRPPAGERELYRTAIETLLECLNFHKAAQERELLEHRLDHAQRLEAVGTLAGGIAHEFNNILGAILGYGEMALGSSLTREQIRRYVTEMVSSGERAKQIIDQILTFSRKTERVRKPFDAAAAIRDIAGLLTVSAPKASRMTFILPEYPLVMLGTPIEVQQIVMNLTKNAFEASPVPSEVVLLVDSISLSQRQTLSHGELSAGKYLRIRVSDCGKGIAPSIMPHIFEPFFTTRSHDGGTGLGLAAVHGSVVALAGQIDVESTVGKGTSFNIYFRQSPLRPVALDAFATGHPVPVGEGKVVVVVEKDDSARMLYEDKLAAFGYEPVGFKDLEPVIQWFSSSRTRPDLLLVDVCSIGGSIATIDFDEKFNRIPYLLMCDAESSLDVHAAAVRMGTVLRKPVDTCTLAEAIFAKLHEAGSR